MPKSLWQSKQDFYILIGENTEFWYHWKKELHLPKLLEFC